MSGCESLFSSSSTRLKSSGGISRSAEVGQALVQDLEAPFEHVGDRGRAVEVTAGLGVEGDAALAAGLGALAEGDVAADAGLAAEDDIVLEGGAARDADLGAEDAVLADDDVVGDLHEVVDLRACPDDRVVDDLVEIPVHRAVVGAGTPRLGFERHAHHLLEAAGFRRVGRLAVGEQFEQHDAFAVLFFVSVGMLFDPSLLLGDPWPLIAAVGLIVVLRSMLSYGLLRVFGTPADAAATVTGARGQIAEFSFILAGIGLQLGLIPEEARNAILGGAIITEQMDAGLRYAITPALITVFMQKLQH